MGQCDMESYLTKHYTIVCTFTIDMINYVKFKYVKLLKRIETLIKNKNTQFKLRSPNLTEEARRAAVTWRWRLRRLTLLCTVAATSRR